MIITHHCCWCDLVFALCCVMYMTFIHAKHFQHKWASLCLKSAWNYDHCYYQSRCVTTEPWELMFICTNSLCSFCKSKNTWHDLMNIEWTVKRCRGQPLQCTRKLTWYVAINDFRSEIDAAACWWCACIRRPLYSCCLYRETWLLFIFCAVTNKRMGT